MSVCKGAHEQAQTHRKRRVPLSPFPEQGSCMYQFNDSMKPLIQRNTKPYMFKEGNTYPSSLQNDIIEKWMSPFTDVWINRILFFSRQNV